MADLENKEGISNPQPVLDDEESHEKNEISKNDKKKPQKSSKDPNDTASKDKAENPEAGDTSEPDFIFSGIDLNSYASKKSFAQAILDLALLSANASQLKFILSVGQNHQFYSLILWLVITSICLQVVQAVTSIILGLIFNINKVDEQKAANIINNVCLTIVVLIVVVNVIISAFDIKYSTPTEKTGING